jgi:hypothetical protein
MHFGLPRRKPFTHRRLGDNRGNRKHPLPANPGKYYVTLHITTFSTFYACISRAGSRLHQQ